MTGSAFHKAVAQNAVQLMQVTGTKGWVAGLSRHCKRLAMLFSCSNFRALTLGNCKASSQRVCDELEICTAPSQGARACTYERRFRKPCWAWADASPLTLILAHAAMQQFLRICTGCHGSPEDVGSQSGVPRYQRVCQRRDTSFGYEMHLVIKCTTGSSAWPFRNNLQAHHAAFHVASRSVAGC